MSVGLIQAAFCKGHLTEECTWGTILLIPKENGNFCVIRLVEVLWKTVTGILNCRLTKGIQFHDTLHGFFTGRGTGTASLEANLPQQLMDMRSEVLHEILLYLHKAYDDLYRDYCLENLAAHGVGPWTLRLLRRYWD